MHWSIRGEIPRNIWCKYHIIIPILFLFFLVSWLASKEIWGTKWIKLHSELATCRISSNSRELRYYYWLIVSHASSTHIISSLKTKQTIIISTIFISLHTASVINIQIAWNKCSMIPFLSFIIPKNNSFLNIMIFLYLLLHKRTNIKHNGITLPFNKKFFFDYSYFFINNGNWKWNWFFY